MAIELILMQLAGLVALIAMSAFFALSETAIVAADRLQLRQLAREGDARARLLERLLDEPERILTTILIGNNVVNIAATALATLVAIGIFGTAGAAIATGVMTFLILVFGEITPKTLAVGRATTIARRAARPLMLVHGVLKPLMWLFTAITRALLGPFGIKWGERQPFATQKMIAQMVRAGVEEGHVEHFEEKVIQEVFDFTDTPLRRVMTPRENVKFLSEAATLQDALEAVARTGHSRLPVAQGDLQHVLGFVHAKDLLRFPDDEMRTRKAVEVLRPVLVAQGDERADHVLARMQRERRLLAVVNEAGGPTIGIATVEDLLEELVGEIHDEFDRQAPAPKARPEAPPASADPSGAKLDASPAMHGGGQAEPAPQARDRQLR